jgi:hypothetical protein
MPSDLAKQPEIDYRPAYLARPLPHSFTPRRPVIRRHTGADHSSGTAAQPERHGIVRVPLGRLVVDDRRVWLRQVVTLARDVLRGQRGGETGRSGRRFHRPAATSVEGWGAHRQGAGG